VVGAGEEYYVQGCVLYNAQIFYPIMAGATVLERVQVKERCCLKTAASVG